MDKNLIPVLLLVSSVSMIPKESDIYIYILGLLLTVHFLASHDNEGANA